MGGGVLFPWIFLFIVGVLFCLFMCDVLLWLPLTNVFFIFLRVTRVFPARFLCCRQLTVLSSLILFLILLFSAAFLLDVFPCSQPFCLPSSRLISLALGNALLFVFLSPSLFLRLLNCLSLLLSPRLGFKTCYLRFLYSSFLVLSLV